MTTRIPLVGQIQEPGLGPRNVDLTVNERPNLSPAEGKAGIKWVDSRYSVVPFIDVRRYGFKGDGTTDDAGPIERACSVAVASGSGDIFIPPGPVLCGSPIPQISLKDGDTGGFSHTATGTVRIIALGAQISYTGSNWMFNVLGTTISTTSPARFEVLGGSVLGTSSGKGALKLRDGNRALIQFEYVGGFDAASSAGILLQNANSWSENIFISGPFGGTTTFIGNMVDIHIEGNTAAEVRDGALGDGGESFARLFIMNLQHGSISASPIGAKSIVVEGSWYDGKLLFMKGNQSNANVSKLIDVQGGMTRTVVSDIKLEGANVDESITLTAVTTDSFNVKDVITDGASAATGTIRKVTGTSPAYTIYYTLDSGTFSSTAETITSDSGGSGTKNASAPTAIATAYILDATGSGNSDQAHPRVLDCDWTGGSAEVINGWGDSVENSAYLHHTNQLFERPIQTTSKITETLTGDQNNWAPTGFANATTLELDGTGTHTITGIAGGIDGRILHIIFTGASGTRTLSDNNGSSSVANRFLVGADIVLTPDDGATFIYTANRWRCVGKHIS